MNEAADMSNSGSVVHYTTLLQR